MSMPDPQILRLTEAALLHVAFDGWTDAAFAAACADLRLSRAQGRAIAPRGAIDLAVAYHRAGDAALAGALAARDLGALRYSDRVALALKLRLDGLDREAVRRASALFALPIYAAEGAALIWGTADAIWRALGDSSTDLNWYTKRATLAAVWGSVILYWLGDASGVAGGPGPATDDFIDRRIAEVMAIEKAKAQVRAAPLLRPLTGAMDRLAAMVRAPGPRDDLPGYWSPPS
jgi:ubiquinone biosynthesis protein COQ9